MKYKTAELTGRALDYAVAIAEGAETSSAFHYSHGSKYWHIRTFSNDLRAYRPSEEPSFGHRIIERECISSRRCYNSGTPNTGQDSWHCTIAFVEGRMTLGWLSTYGSTMLEAAMRCYVLKKFGEEVELPEGL